MDSLVGEVRTSGTAPAGIILSNLAKVVMCLWLFLIRHGPNFGKQKSENGWDLWYHISSIRFHCPRFGVFIVPKDSQLWN